MTTDKRKKNSVIIENVHLRIPYIMEQAGGQTVTANDDCLLYECLRYANTFRFKYNRNAEATLNERKEEFKYKIRKKKNR